MFIKTQKRREFYRVDTSKGPLVSRGTQPGESNLSESNLSGNKYPVALLPHANLLPELPLGEPNRNPEGAGKLLMDSMLVTPRG